MRLARAAIVDFALAVVLNLLHRLRAVIYALPDLFRDEIADSGNSYA
jgi:hypothetical protein